MISTLKKDFATMPVGGTAEYNTGNSGLHERST